MSERAAGRIVNVWTEEVGTTLTQDEAAGVTVLHVDDVAVFNDDGDGGWLTINGQVVAYTDVDDDASTVTIAELLADDADEDDPVNAWSDLYGEVDSRQWASVDVDGKGDRADYIEAVVPEHLELADDDRGKRGESCVIRRNTDSDDWTVRRVFGRPSKAAGMKAEADDAYILTADDVTAGVATVPLSHVPVDESIKLVLGGVPQEPTNYTVGYDAATITFPLDGWEPAGLRFWVHYWYLHGPVAAAAEPGVVTPHFVGAGNIQNGSGGGTITSISPVGGTVSGDLVLLALTSGDGGTASCSDPRMTHLADVAVTGGADFGLWIGHWTGDSSPLAITLTTAWALASIATFRGADGMPLNWSAGDVTVVPSTASTTDLLPAVASGLSGAVMVYMNRAFSGPESDQTWTNAPSWTPHYEHSSTRFVCNMATADSPTAAELTPHNDSAGGYWWAVVVGLELG